MENFLELKNIFKSKTLRKEIKINIFRTVPVVLLYGYENLKITKKLEQSLNSLWQNATELCSTSTGARESQTNNS